jgi:hypothetical protein
VWQASKILAMSYADLDEHPRKFNLMTTAFTLNSAERQVDEYIKAIEKSKAKVANG